MMDEQNQDTAPPAAHRRARWLTRGLFESALIVFSVFLALALDEWRENRRETARARQAIEAVVSELQTNRAAIETAMNRHLETARIMQEISARGEVVSEEVASRGGLRAAQLVATAWTSAATTGFADQWPYELVIQVARLYERQNSYRALGEQLGADVYMDIRRRGFDAVLRREFGGTLVLIVDFSNRERNLLKEYDEVLSAIRAVGSSPG